MKTPGLRFQHVATELRLNNVQLADLLDVSPSAITRLGSMKDLSPTRKKRLHLLTEKYNVNLDWIATGQGEPFLKEGQVATDDKYEALRAEYEEKFRLHEETKEALRQTIAAKEEQIERMKELMELQNRLLEEMEKKGK